MMPVGQVELEVEAQGRPDVRRYCVYTCDLVSGQQSTRPKSVYDVAIVWENNGMTYGLRHGGFGQSSRLEVEGSLVGFCALITSSTVKGACGVKGLRTCWT